MSISRIVSFTSDTSLLNRIKNQPITQQITQETIQQTVPQIQPAAGQDSYTKKNENEKSPVKSNNKVRNWCIGIGSAAGLIGLVMLGRSGKLGKGLQKLFGGAEKKSGEAADDASRRGNEIIDDITGPEEINGGAGSRSDDIIGSGIDDPADDISRKIDIDTSEVTIKGKTYNFEKINAELDRTIPKIPEPLTIEVPKLPDYIEEIRKLVENDLATRPSGHINIQTKDGKNYSILFENKHICAIKSDTNLLIFRNDQTIINKCLDTGLTVEYVDGQITWVNGGGKLFYSTEGKLTGFCQSFNSGERKIKKISLINEEGYIDIISYRDITGDKNFRIKDDYYNKDGKLIAENFYDDEGQILKQIRYD